MKHIKFITLIITLIALLLFAACSAGSPPGDISTPSSDSLPSDITTSTSDSPQGLPDSSSTSPGQIYLYGEQHGIEKILNKEFELWSEYYNDENMRHLFVELPYYTTEFLNIWMHADSDDILNTLYDEWDGAASHVPSVKDFYKKIKNECPDTIFHGTDVGHQYDTTGKRFLEYLEANSLKDSDQYLLAQDAIEQGKYYKGNVDHVYRENKMVENFIREFDKLNGETVMGIYGGGHTGLDAMDDATRSVPCTANQLKEHYGDNVHSEDLAWMVKDIEPSRTETIEVNEKEYMASYYGKEDLSWHEEYAYREFWRLENAYDDFKDKPKTGDVLPYFNYPMLIEEGQVYVIDYIKKDDSVVRMHHRSDGNNWEGKPSTEGFTIE